MTRFAVLPLVLVALAACGGDDASPATTVPATTTSVVLTSDGVLRVRPAESLLTIDNDMQIGAFGDDDPDNTMVSANLDSSIAYQLGRSVADETDLVSAEAVSAGGAWTVHVVFTDGATARISDLAARCVSAKKPCEAGQLVITVDGTAMSALPVLDAAVGPEFDVGSGLNEVQADTIAAALTAG